MRYVLFLISALVVPSMVFAANCDLRSIGATPINDLGPGLYLNAFEGGFYPGGANLPPSAHGAAGAAAAQRIRPLNTAGVAVPNGRIVLLSIGMSNASAEFRKFIVNSAEHPDVDRSSLTIVNGAASGLAIRSWDSPDREAYDRVRDVVLAGEGLTEAQVQAVWLKGATGSPTVSLPNQNADAFDLTAGFGAALRALRVRYPNLQLVFLSTRTYGGYASVSLNPEPFAYETAFAAKWTIEAQIQQAAGNGTDPIAGDLHYPDAAPWVAWGPYLWADGLVPRSDGLTWECADFQQDGTHPSASGNAKVSELLLDHFLNSPFTSRWFRATGCPADGDVNQDGRISPRDTLWVLQEFLGQRDFDACMRDHGDVDGSGDLSPADGLLIFETFLGL